MRISELVHWARQTKIKNPCMKAALLAPFSIPIIGLCFSLFEPMPNYAPINTIGQALEYVGLFSIGALVIGFPLALFYGFPVLWWTSKNWPTKPRLRILSTLFLSLIPSVVIIAGLQEVNYFTNLCIVMSVTTAICAQILLFRLEDLEDRRVDPDTLSIV